MRILDNKLEDWPKNIACASCESMLEVEPSDLEVRRLPQSGMRYYFKCAVCQQSNEVPVNEIPMELR